MLSEADIRAGQLYMSSFRIFHRNSCIVILGQDKKFTAKKQRKGIHFSAVTDFSSRRANQYNEEAKKILRIHFDYLWPLRNNLDSVPSNINRDGALRKQAGSAVELNYASFVIIVINMSQTKTHSSSCRCNVARKFYLNIQSIPFAILNRKKKNYNSRTNSSNVWQQKVIKFSKKKIMKSEKLVTKSMVRVRLG